jgi:hypothetical protein
MQTHHCCQYSLAQHSCSARLARGRRPAQDRLDAGRRGCGRGSCPRWDPNLDDLGFSLLFFGLPTGASTTLVVTLSSGSASTVSATLAALPGRQPLLRLGRYPPEPRGRARRARPMVDELGRGSCGSWCRLFLGALCLHFSRSAPLNRRAKCPCLLRLALKAERCAAHAVET